MWTWCIVARPNPSHPTEFTDPQAAVREAMASHTWPDRVEVAADALPASDQAAGWIAALTTLAQHHVTVWLVDHEWAPGQPLGAQWPPGSPSDWTPDQVPQGWDAASGCWTEAVGAVWWERQPADGTGWRLGVARIGADETAPDQVGAVLRAITPADGIVVRSDADRWWAAWPMHDRAPSGAAWVREVRLRLGPVRAAAVMVANRAQWTARRDRAVQIMRPGGEESGAAEAAEPVCPDAQPAEPDASIAAQRWARQAVQAEGTEPTWPPGPPETWPPTVQAVARDPLSGAWLRGAGERWIATQPPDAGPWAVVFADLDGLKHTNDTDGHAAGDDRIRAAGAWLRERVPSRGCVIRWGGDEWLVIWPMIDAPSADGWMRVHAADAAAHGLSLGGAPCERVADWPDAIRRADEAMLRARQRRREAGEAAAVPITPAAGSAEPMIPDASPVAPSSKATATPPANATAPAASAGPVAGDPIPQSGRSPTIQWDPPTESPAAPAAAPRSGKTRRLPSKPAPPPEVPRLVRRRSPDWSWRTGQPTRWADAPAPAPTDGGGVSSPPPAPPSAEPRLGEATPSPVPSVPPAPDHRVIVLRARPARRLARPAAVAPADTTTGRGLVPPWVAWVWGTQRKAGATTVAIAVARWLAWWQDTPVLLLDGHIDAPGLHRLLQIDHPQPGLGWEASWTGGTPRRPPPEVVTLGPTLTAWVTMVPIRASMAQRMWPGILQAQTDRLVVVDGGVLPPPVPVALPLCVVPGMSRNPPAPHDTWFVRRAADGQPHTLVVPSEPLGVEGVGSAAWTAAWEPLADHLTAQRKPAGT